MKMILVLSALFFLNLGASAFAVNEEKEAAIVQEKLENIDENRTQDKLTDLDRRIVQLERDIRDIRDSIRYLDRDVDDLQRKVR